MPGLGKPFARLELAGKTFGRLTVLQPSKRRHDKHGNVLWDCRCICGTELMVRGKALSAGNTQSCGCLQRERTRASNARMKQSRGSETMKNGATMRMREALDRAALSTEKSR